MTKQIVRWPIKSKKAQQVILCTSFLALGSNATFASNCADKEPFYWQGDRRLAVYDKLMQFMQCKDYGDKTENAQNDASACNWFLARSLQSVYGIDDFTPEGGGWKSANTIASDVDGSDKWEKMGSAGDQTILSSAAEAAAAGSAVVAVSTGEGHGHVAIILGGPLSKSNSWGLDVPNSTSFKLNDASSSYVGCKLSFAWGKPDGVSIYKRK